MKTLVHAAAAAMLAACATAAPPAPAVKLYAMDCGKIAMQDADYFADDGSMKGVAQDLPASVRRSGLGHGPA